MARDYALHQRGAEPVRSVLSSRTKPQQLQRSTPGALGHVPILHGLLASLVRTAWPILDEPTPCRQAGVPTKSRNRTKGVRFRSSRRFAVVLRSHGAAKKQGLSRHKTCAKSAQIYSTTLAFRPYTPCVTPLGRPLERKCRASPALFGGSGDDDQQTVRTGGGIQGAAGRA